MEKALAGCQQYTLRFPAINHRLLRYRQHRRPRFLLCANDVQEHPRLERVLRIVHHNSSLEGTRGSIHLRQQLADGAVKALARKTF
ncbi:hypothetical protein D3C80_1475900 [compost metagenome]